MSTPQTTNHHATPQKEPKPAASKAAKQKWLIIGAVIAAICIISLYVWSQIGKGAASVQPEYDSDGTPVYIDDSAFDNIYNDTDPYRGKFVKFGGVVFGEPEQDGTRVMFQVWADAKNLEKNTIILYDGDLDVKADDLVNITGYIAGTMDFENAFGGQLSAPVIIATELEKGTYAQIVAPATKTTSFSDQSINQHGYTISVDKVEFAEDETRLYVTAENNAAADLSLYTYSSAVIIQDGKQYEYESNYQADYEELQSDIKPGVKSSGILTFPKIEPTDFQFIIDGHSNDWDIDLNEYVFNLNIM